MKEHKRCTDRRGNEVCTNGKDTYHEWNARYSHCQYCGATERKEERGDGSEEPKEDKCECERCTKCGKLI